jgi:hypothetical protein
MEWRGRRLVWGCLLVTAAGLAGCTDAVTVHPLVTAETRDPDVPSITGTWIAGADAGSGKDIEDLPTLEIEGNEADLRQCRKGRIVFHEGSDTSDVGQDVCFVDINGHLIAEVQTPAPYVFYRQFLVRVDRDAIAVCGALPVWVLLQDIQDSSVTGYSLESLPFTVRKRNDDDLMVFISKSRELRDFLELALPELASVCDRAEAAGKRDFDDFTWVVFERAPPQPEQPVEE